MAFYRVKTGDANDGWIGHTAEPQGALVRKINGVSYCLDLNSTHGLPEIGSHGVADSYSQTRP